MSATAAVVSVENKSTKTLTENKDGTHTETSNKENTTVKTNDITKNIETITQISDIGGVEVKIDWSKLVDNVKELFK